MSTPNPAYVDPPSQDCECAHVPPYGFVPEAGCPTHDQKEQDVRRAFDPEHDFPPNGAQVRTLDFTATFHGDRTLPGWYRDDGAYARPFDETGIALARIWADRDRS